jgi:hypothetical protein
VFLWRWTEYAIFLLLGIPGMLVVTLGFWHFVYSLALLTAVSLRWAPRGVRCLVIHSDSPVWAPHVIERWLPRLAAQSEVLNWSQRASWHNSLAVRLFRHFCGTQRNFNPAVVVFRGLRYPLVFRFFYAFQEARTGRSQYLAQLESQMFEILKPDSAA